MSGPAYVGSFEAVRDFRAALVIFLHEAREALASHDMEVRRTLEWLFDVEPKRWQQIVRSCDEEVVRAKIDLERCRHSKLPGGDPRSCLEERKTLERARQRRHYAEQKIEAVRKWAHLVEREADEYAGRASQLSTLVDVDLVGAIAMLDRALTSLESYSALRHLGGSTVGASGGRPVTPIELAYPESVEAQTPSPLTSADLKVDELSREDRSP